MLGEIDESLLRKMADILRHRGPDESGFFVDDEVALGNVRLKIIDLLRGRQPIFNEDESVVVVYNGEIYNFREIRDDLEKKGHRFYTNTDTEVIVHAYEEYGHKCVNQFNGMFAFALWDANKKELFIARDRSGIKPIYYYISKNLLIFASEIKAILLHPDVKREVDLQAFHYFINLRYVPKEYTLVKGVKKLLPGHYMIINDKKEITVSEYWCLKPEPKFFSEKFVIERLKEILGRAVRRHLISDVPLGVFLSSGLDSSTIVAVASKVSVEPIKTFTLVFGDPRDEHREARELAETFGTDHREVYIEENKLLKDYPLMIWYADMPKRNLYPYYLYKAVSKYVKVILTGLGGDELFGGYDWKYQFATEVEKLRSRLSAETRETIINNSCKVIDFLTEHGSLSDIELINNLKKYCYLDNNVNLYLKVSSLEEVFSEGYLKRNIYGKTMHGDLRPVNEIFEQYFKGNKNFIDQILIADYKIKMVDDFLHVDDTMSMANSIESRVPFLDCELVDFAFSIPSYMKFNGNTSKYILKKAMKDTLPKEVLRREKRGFGVDVFLRFRNEIKGYAEQILPKGNAIKLGLIKKDYITKVIEHYPEPQMVKHYTLLWNLLAFELWFEIFMNRDEIRRPKGDIDSFIR